MIRKLFNKEKRYQIPYSQYKVDIRKSVNLSKLLYVNILQQQKIPICTMSTECQLLSSVKERYFVT